MDVEEGEDLEEGEDSDTASAGLLGDEEDATGTAGENRARWSTKKYGSGRKDNGEDAHRIAPSPVVHVRGLCESVVEGDLVEALEKFGNICYVMMMPFKRQALVEFEAMESADQCVTCGANEAVYIAGQQAFFNYSTSKRITRPTNADDPNSGNKVLLLSIQNPLYPITTDVLYTVCNPIGNVLRIVIFKRNGIQAMLLFLNGVATFETVKNAQKAKSALNGADIYAGCCTLKIEYARVNTLTNPHTHTVLTHTPPGFLWTPNTHAPVLCSLSPCSPRDSTSSATTMIAGTTPSPFSSGEVRHPSFLLNLFMY
ncbi:unnamed protein product [Oncorhynchus mykiss]|uniref:RRM domain-containing protein n=1 Tax=Oncorhynchus mykiss TaxID=8022 RepID=A0A060VRK7_ONCMY|nr:unnamed protein product [Oncorhynchus mykiss]